jgi:hypothetical protein
VDLRASELIARIRALIAIAPTHPEVGDYYRERTRLHDRAWMVMDRPPGRIYLGECDKCKKDLYVLTFATRFICGCGVVYMMEERKAQLLESARDFLGTATFLAGAITPLSGRRVTSDRIRQWAHRGRITPHGIDRRGDPVYRVGDVLDLVDQGRY